MLDRFIGQGIQDGAVVFLFDVFAEGDFQVHRSPRGADVDEALHEVVREFRQIDIDEEDRCGFKALEFPYRREEDFAVFRFRRDGNPVEGPAAFEATMADGVGREDDHVFQGDALLAHVLDEAVGLFLQFFFVPIKDGFRCHALDGVDITVFHVHQLANGRSDFSRIAAILIENQATFGVLVNPARRLAAHYVLVAVIEDVETAVLQFGQEAQVFQDGIAQVLAFVDDDVGIRPVIIIEFAFKVLFKRFQSTVQRRRRLY